MLLSMYASYHWVKISKKPYVLRMTVFIILVSLLSVFFAIPWGVFFGGVVSPVLSFPFYAISTEVLGSPIPPEGYSYWIQTYQIHFLATEILATKPHDFVEPDWTYRFLGYRITFLNMEIEYVARQNLEQTGYYTLPFSFSFFMLVNVVGALLGYRIGRIRRIRQWGTNKRWGLLGLILGFVFLGLGLWLSNIGIAETRWWGYPITSYPYRDDALAFFLFGIIAWAIVIGKILLSTIFPEKTSIKGHIYEN